MENEIKLRDSGVEVSALAKSVVPVSIVDKENDTVTIFISSSYDDDVLCTLDRRPESKYMINGNAMPVMYAALVLNSGAGKLQFISKGKAVVNKRTIGDIFLPNAEYSAMSAGAFLTTYRLIVKRELEDENLSEKSVQNLKILQSFLSLVESYFVEELFIPQIYEQNNVSIVKEWEDIMEILPSPESDNIHDILLNLFNIILKHGDNLLNAFNQMKVYQVDTFKALHEHLIALKS